MTMQTKFEGQVLPRPEYPLTNYIFLLHDEVNLSQYCERKQIPDDDDEH